MSDSKDRPNRSVNDFHNAHDLRRAMTSGGMQRSEADGRHVSFAHAALQGDDQDTTTKRTASLNANQIDDCLNPQLDWVLENYKQETTEPQTLEEELNRLMALKSYMILDSERKVAFERVTGLASRIFNCSMALVSLVDLGRQWFMSNRGLGEARETSRKFAFCAHCIMGKEEFLIVPDAKEDPRFVDNPLVTGPPHIRFYAGAPLISPEGFKLGTLCVLETVPRPNGFSLEEKMNLMELASLAVQVLVDHKRQRTEEVRNPAQLIASTAHDLLTPLTGVQLSLSLLAEDDDLSSKLTSQQKEILATASNCADVMGRICQSTLDTYRKNTKPSLKRKYDQEYPKDDASASKAAPLNMSGFVKSIYTVMDPLPKKVPLVIALHPSVPETIVTDDLKVFRAAVNYLTNACSKTVTGSIQLSISVASDSRQRMLLFECEDTGPGVPVERYTDLFRPLKTDPSAREDKDDCIRPDGGFDAVRHVNMPNSGLGLFSVAVHIGSIGGEYGYRPRVGNDTVGEGGTPSTGSTFWFKIPLVEPDSVENSSPAGVERDQSKKVPSTGDTLHSSSEEKPSFDALHTQTLTTEQADMVHSSFTTVLEDNSQLEDMKKRTGASWGDDKSMASASSGLVTASVASVEQKRKRRALVIEDSVVVRKSLTRVLMNLGFETSQAKDGMEGLLELKRSLFDLVLCDFLMPVLDGLDCVQQYREWEKENRPFFQQYIIGISAHASELDVARGLEVGMDDFKPKPVTYKQLADMEKSGAIKVIGERLEQIASAEASHNDGAEEKTELDTAEELENSATLVASDTSIHVCLIASNQNVSVTNLLTDTANRKGWKSVVVSNGDDALRLMKTRNWDTILLDEDLPVLESNQVVARFRDWEDLNRIHRQRNIALLTSCNSKMMMDSNSVVQIPLGFDLTMQKPVQMNEFERQLSRAERSESDFGVTDAIIR